MKTFFKLLSAAVIALATVACSKDQAENPMRDLFHATCTFHPSEDGTFYIMVDDQTALRLVNPSMDRYPFKHKKEQRALISFSIDEAADALPVEGFKTTHTAFLHGVDTIRTKNPMMYDSSEEEAYGNDYIGLYLGNNIFPTTLVEDGYLNLCFTMPFGYLGVAHEINLVMGKNPNDPYELEVRHNAHGNVGPNDQSFLCCFPLKDLPSTNGKTVKLTLKWRSQVTGNVESVQFDYCSRENW